MSSQPYTTICGVLAGVRLPGGAGEGIKLFREREGHRGCVRRARFCRRPSAALREGTAEPPSMSLLPPPLRSPSCCRRSSHPAAAAAAAAVATAGGTTAVNPGRDPPEVLLPAARKERERSQTCRAEGEAAETRVPRPTQRITPVHLSYLLMIGDEEGTPPSLARSLESPGVGLLPPAMAVGGKPERAGSEALSFPCPVP